LVGVLEGNDERTNPCRKKGSHAVVLDHEPKPTRPEQPAVDGHRSEEHQGIGDRETSTFFAVLPVWQENPHGGGAPKGVPENPEKGAKGQSVAQPNHRIPRPGSLREFLARPEVGCPIYFMSPDLGVGVMVVVRNDPHSEAVYQWEHAEMAYNCIDP